jgi:hypothetical protein
MAAGLVAAVPAVPAVAVVAAAAAVVVAAGYVGLALGVWEQVVAGGLVVPLVGAKLGGRYREEWMGMCFLGVRGKRFAGKRERRIDPIGGVRGAEADEPTVP